MQKSEKSSLVVVTNPSRYAIFIGKHTDVLNEKGGYHALTSITAERNHSAGKFTRF